MGKQGTGHGFGLATFNYQLSLASEKEVHNRRFRS